MNPHALYPNIYPFHLFDTAQQAVIMAKRIAEDNGFKLHITNTSSSGRVVLRCNKEGKKWSNTRRTIDKTDCLYCVHIKPQKINKDEKKFTITVPNAEHNHPLNEVKKKSVTIAPYTTNKTLYTTPRSSLPSYSTPPIQTSVDMQQTLHQLINTFVSDITPNTIYTPSPQTFPYHDVNTVMPNIATVSTQSQQNFTAQQQQQQFQPTTKDENNLKTILEKIEARYNNTSSVDKAKLIHKINALCHCSIQEDGSSSASQDQEKKGLIESDSNDSLMQSTRKPQAIVTKKRTAIALQDSSISQDTLFDSRSSDKSVNNNKKTYSIKGKNYKMDRVHGKFKKQSNK